MARIEEVVRRHRVFLGAPAPHSERGSDDGGGGGAPGCNEGIFPLSAACNLTGRVGITGGWAPNATRWYDAERGLLITQTTHAIEMGERIRVLQVHAPKEADPHQPDDEAQENTDTSRAEAKCGAKMSAGVTTPLHVAAARGEVEACVALVTAGANVSAQDELGLTALEWAVLSGHAAVAGRLLQCGPEQVTSTCEGLTPLMLACAMGEVNVVAALLEGTQ